MTRIARETPPRSGSWVITGEPDPRHPRRAPQFECSGCSRRIARTRTHYLTEGNHVVCVRCLTQAVHAAFFLDCPERWHDTLDHSTCHGTLAGIAAYLGIWPPKPGPVKVSFRQWLKRFDREPTAIGDLARDVYLDWRWPRGRGSLPKYEVHLEEIGASSDALATLREAWGRYERERGA